MTSRGESEEKGPGLSAVDAGPRPLIVGKSDPPGAVAISVSTEDKTKTFAQLISEVYTLCTYFKVYCLLLYLGAFGLCEALWIVDVIGPIHE